MLGVETLLLPVSFLDWLRTRLFSLLGPLGQPIVRRPELRVALRGSVAVLLALTGTILLPLWILALGPLILGVPHLLSDARYLVVRPGHQRSPRLVLAVGIPLVICGLGVGMPAGLAALAGVFLVSDGALWRRGIGLSLVGALALWGYAAHSFYPHELWLAHLHNPIGVLIWFLWRPRHERLHLIPLLLYVACATVIGLGVVHALPFGLSAAPHSDGSALEFFRDTLAPEFSETWGTRLVLLYCYAQMVHYSVWLQLVPEEDRPRPTPRSFRESLRVLFADLSWPLLLLAMLIALSLLLFALRDVWAARTAYFRLATFHGYLELCALGLWFVKGQRPQKARRLVETAQGFLPVSAAAAHR
ncbi:MAG TPA: hypothetical protein PK472_02585 [Pseudomonadota bacterium]|nr:hypothetical protein [Pseudomonadota bacterium]